MYNIYGWILIQDAYALAVYWLQSRSLYIGITCFEAGRYTLTDNLTGFEMGQGATIGFKYCQPASK